MTRPYRSKKAAAALLAELVPSGQPLSAMIEIADRCNEKCVHCYQVQGLKGEMTTAELCQVMDELSEMGVLFLTLSGGEATLRSDFLELVAYARERRFSVKIYSNGLRIDEPMAKALHELAVQEVQISLYSVTPEKHDWVVSVPGAWEKTVRAARLLCHEGVNVVLKTPIMHFNGAELDAYRALCADIGADYMFDPGRLLPREDGDRSPEWLSATEEQVRRVQSDPTLAKPMPKGPHPSEIAPDARLDQAPCGACRSLHIEANGEVRPCAQLDLAVGNVAEGVKAAYESDEASFVRSLTWADIVGCRQCALRAYCVRCHHSARTEVGDALAPYPTACAGARLVASTRSERELRLPREVGPYRFEGDELVAFDEPMGEYDLRLRTAHRWIRRDAEPAVDGPSAAAGDLVPIRRPGKTRKERLPIFLGTPSDLNPS